jgi:hypothetical protein
MHQVFKFLWKSISGYKKYYPLLVNLRQVKNIVAGKVKSKSANSKAKSKPKKAIKKAK